MKDKIEIEFEKLSKIYFEKFGDNYPLVITGNKSLEEVNKRIKECLEIGKPEEEPEYESGAYY